MTTNGASHLILLLLAKKYFSSRVSGIKIRNTRTTVFVTSKNKGWAHRWCWRLVVAARTTVAGSPMLVPVFRGPPQFGLINRLSFEPPPASLALMRSPLLLNSLTFTPVRAISPSRFIDVYMCVRATQTRPPSLRFHTLLIR